MNVQRDWRQQFQTHAKALDCAVYEHELGIGIDFEDGCDAFWVLPGEVTSTIPVPVEGPASVDELIARYDAISRVRERALHVIRHYLASRNIRVDRSPDGAWALELEGGASTSLYVGAYLTTVARDTDDVYETVKAAIEHSFVRKVPSRRRIDRYLNTDGPPANEQPIGEGREPQPLIPQTIPAALTWMGLCKALETVDDNVSSEALAARAAPTGRIAQALLRLGERVPNVKASCDLMKPATLSLDYEGGGSFDIDTQSRELARRIARDGPTVAGDQLAEEYLRRQADRAAVFAAINQAAAARGWARNEFGGVALFGVGAVTHLGHYYREVSYPPDKVDELVERNAPEAVLRTLFADNPDFAQACVEALHHPQPDAKAIALPEKNLLPRDIPPAPPLRQLDQATIEAMDQFARRRLWKYPDSDRNLWDYLNRDKYDPAIDTWATPTDWVRAAAPHVNAEWVNPIAILILLDAGDGRGDTGARKYLRQATPHDEVSDAEVEIVWRYRHEYPDVARAWFAPQINEDVPYREKRAKLGDPIAARTLAFAPAADDPEEDDLAPQAVRQLPPDRQAQVHQRLLAWARTDHHWSPPDNGKLRIALAMGWRDVADAMADNPYLLPGLLGIDRRSDQMDEPGMLLAGDFLLVWSRLSPSPFLAQLLATAQAMDLAALADEASRRSAVGKPEVQKHLASSSSIYRSWLADVHVAMAIAWTRCQPHLQ